MFEICHPDSKAHAAASRFSRFVQSVSWVAFVSVLAGCGGGSDGGSAPEGPSVSADMVRINEFVASNDGGQSDEDGDRPDWIEIYNASDEPANLNQWALTDDADNLGKWLLPDVTISSGQYLIVFASGKDRRAPAGELHTNFRLSADGEYLALVQANGAVATQFAPKYPAQSSDISYGFDNQLQAAFLSTATPGQANSAAGLAIVVPSRQAGLFTGAIDLTLSQQEGATGTIHYTLEGSEPDSQSPAYQGPIRIDATTRIRARVISEGLSGIEWASTYTLIDTDVASFESTLPVVVVDTTGQPITTDFEQAATLTLIEPDGSATRLASAANGVLKGNSGNATVRIRGRTSAEFPKKQYRVELRAADGGNRSESLLGLGGENDWILYAPGRYDRNYVANPLIQRLAGKVGLDEMSMRYVEVYVNEGGGPVSADDYAGIYLLTEAIKIDDDRIDITELSGTDTTEPDVTGGYILSFDGEITGRSDPELFSFTTTAANGFGFEGLAINIERPKLNQLVPAQSAWISDYMNRFEAAVYGPNSSDANLGYRAFIDVDSWIDSHLLSLFAQEVDFLFISHFMYKDRAGKLVSGPLWDFDRSLNSDDPRDDDPQMLFQGRQFPLPFYYRWWDALFNDPSFQQQYRDRWNQLRSDALATSEIFADIDELAAQVAPAYVRENDRWGATAGYGSRYGNFEGEITALKQWISLRVAFLDQRLNQPLK